MAMNRMFCTKKHFKCHWGKVRTTHSSLQSRKVKKRCSELTEEREEVGRLRRSGRRRREATKELRRRNICQQPDS